MLYCMMRMRVCCTSAEALKSESDWWELEYILWHKRTERDIILPRHYLIPEMLIDNSLKTLGISPSYTHVKGHQDKGLVAPELERIQPTPSVPFAAETGVKLEEVDGHTITHHIPSQIRTAPRKEVPGQATPLGTQRIRLDSLAYCPTIPTNIRHITTEFPETTEPNYPFNVIA